VGKKGKGREKEKEKKGKRRGDAEPGEAGSDPAPFEERLDRLARHAARLSRPYRVEQGAKLRLDDFDPADTGELDAEDKPEAQEALAEGIEALKQLQERLYAQDEWAVLLIFQAMDAAGKDSTIEHVMSGVNPQGCQVFSFKAPSSEELDHDFLWRCSKCLPERGRIGIFNRSWYEEVLVVRVHRRILEAQKLPPRLVGKGIWDERLEDIRAYERYLARNGVAIVKFFLNVSKEEQRERFLARIDEPEKNWKFSARDVAERAHWDDYRDAYERAIRATAAPEAPWYVVPADHKWYLRLVVASAVIDTLAGLDLKFPELPPEERAALAEARRALESE